MHKIYRLHLLPIINFLPLLLSFSLELKSAVLLDHALVVPYTAVSSKARHCSPAAFKTTKAVM